MTAEQKALVAQILVDKPEAARLLSLSVREIDERRFAEALPSDEPAA